MDGNREGRRCPERGIRFAVLPLSLVPGLLALSPVESPFNDVATIAPTAAAPSTPRTAVRPGENRRCATEPTYADFTRTGSPVQTCCEPSMVLMDFTPIT